MTISTNKKATPLTWQTYSSNQWMSLHKAMITPSRWLENTLGKKIIISLLRIETWIHFIQGLFVTLFETDQSSVYFNVIYHYLPLEKGVTVWPWTKLNSLYLIGWNGPSGYRESVFKYPHCTFAISENLYCLLNWIERCPFLEHTWVRVIQGCCVSGLLEIGSVWSLQFVLLLTLRIEVLLWQLSLA